MSMLSPEDLARLSSAESLFPSPIPVQSISSDEFMPGPQTEKQREFEVRVKEMGTQMAKRLGMSRRRFFQSAAGMATAFLALNDTYGPLYGCRVPKPQSPSAQTIVRKSCPASSSWTCIRIFCAPVRAFKRSSTSAVRSARPDGIRTSPARSRRSMI